VSCASSVANGLEALCIAGIFIVFAPIRGLGLASHFGNAPNVDGFRPSYACRGYVRQAAAVFKPVRYSPDS